MGDAFTSAVLAALDVNGDKVLSCNEYQLSKFTALPAGSSEAAAVGKKLRSVKLPKLQCKLGRSGKATLAKLVRQLQRPARSYKD